MTTSKTPPTRLQAAIAEIRQLVQLHSLTHEELVALEPKGQSTWERQRRIAFEQCRQLVDFWRIQPSELRGPRPEGAVTAGPRVKYRHPVSGETWDGEGSQPEWLREALLKQGYTVQALRATDPAQAPQGEEDPGKATEPTSRTA